jgi:hypothetical protein
MLEIAGNLKKIGHEVKVPPNLDNYINKNNNIENKEEKKDLSIIKYYFEEIKEQDAILVINKDKNNFKNYIGANALIEMAFAHVLNKKIFLLNPIPEISYSDEIEAVFPIVIDNDLEKIK